MEAVYLTRSVVLLGVLTTIKTWSFGGFGLDKTYVLIFFEALVQALVQLVSQVNFNLDRYISSGTSMPQVDDFCSTCHALGLWGSSSSSRSSA